MPVTTTMSAEREGSAPVNRAPARARGVVIQRVSGASAVTLGVMASSLASMADEVKPNPASMMVMMMMMMMM